MATLATANTVATLNGNFKETYGDDVNNLIPDGVILMKEVPFVKNDQKTGNQFHQPVIVAMEHGFSYGGTAGDAFALNDAVPGQTKDAVVGSYEFILRTALSNATISRSMNSKASFKQATKLVIANMVRSFAKRLEVIMLYGQRDIGVISSVTGSGASRTLTLTTASWASGIWSGAKNMRVSIWDTSSSYAAEDAAGFKVTAVDIVARTVTVQETTSSAAATIAATDILTHFGAGYYQESSGSNEFAGLEKICRNTGSLFGIDAAQYDLWKSTVYPGASAQISFDMINSAIATAVAKGLEEDVVCHVSPLSWANLLSDQAAQKRNDSSYSSKKAQNGSEQLEFYGQNGKITIRSNIYIKEGLAFIVPEKDCLMKVGSTDVTFKQPGGNDEFFKPMENYSGVELRAYADLALFCACPAKLILVDAIIP